MTNDEIVLKAISDEMDKLKRLMQSTPSRHTRNRLADEYGATLAVYLRVSKVLAEKPSLEGVK